jgi:hypothetical protein
MPRELQVPAMCMTTPSDESHESANDTEQESFLSALQTGAEPATSRRIHGPLAAGRESADRTHANKRAS